MKNDLGREGMRECGRSIFYGGKKKRQEWRGRSIIQPGWNGKQLVKKMTDVDYELKLLIQNVSTFHLANEIMWLLQSTTWNSKWINK